MHATDGLLWGFFLLSAIGIGSGMTVSILSHGSPKLFAINCPLGVAGAFVSGFVAPQAGLSIASSAAGGLLMSTAGALLFIGLYHRARKGREKR